MKTKPILIIIALLSTLTFSVAQDKENEKSAEKKATEILTMEVIKDGYYLVQMEQIGQIIFANFKVTSNKLECVSATLDSAVGMSGGYYVAGNGVFMVQVRNQKHASTQFWAFKPDGNANIKEVPDRGEKHRVWPVKDASILTPPTGKEAVTGE
jgi:hypothetical protein